MQQTTPKSLRYQQTHTGDKLGFVREFSKWRVCRICQSEGEGDCFAEGGLKMKRYSYCTCTCTELRAPCLTGERRSCILHNIYDSVSQLGCLGTLVAQVVEHLPSMQYLRGSNPT